MLEPVGKEGRRGEGEVVEAGEGLWAAFRVLLPYYMSIWGWQLNWVASLKLI